MTQQHFNLEQRKLNYKEKHQISMVSKLSARIKYTNRNPYSDSDDSNSNDENIRPSHTTEFDSRAFKEFQNQFKRWIFKKF